MIPTLARSRTALIVVDAQRGMAEREAAGERRNEPGAEGRIADLLGAFRGAGAAVIHVRHDSVEPASRLRPGLTGHAPLDEARERAGEPVLHKKANSAFIGTDLEAHLRHSGLTTLVICGAVTNHCVETTTRMAGNLGFDALLGVFKPTSRNGMVANHYRDLGFAEAGRDEDGTTFWTCDLRRYVAFHTPVSIKRADA